MVSTEKRQQETNDRQQDQTQKVATANDAMEDDGSPVLDEQDLVENDLTEEEADNIEWDEPQGDSTR